MKKNLKKVISAVLALTLAMSSFVAMTTSAATFADVADTANYAEAVNALAALGAISGYEDGTFLPDNNITRAEVTTMLVAALNMSADAQASGATTKFADVNEKAKWAAGYVNVGVANGWISGMSATEFAPSDNVTYAQVLSMLTRILGYGDYAVSKGGWPDGYLAAASSAGILSGVSAAANDAMTRAQVARLIWNTVQAPMLEVTTFGVDAMNSTMTKLDGTSKGGYVFKTILSDKFDAYVYNNVEVAGVNDKGELTLNTLVKAYDPSNPGTADSFFAKDEQISDKVSVGKTDAKDYLYSSAKVIVTYVDDEWELVYFAPTSRISTTTIDGSLAADVNSELKLLVNKSATSTATKAYQLTSDAKLYINGAEVATITADNDDVIDALNAAVGDVVLYEDRTESNKYDKVMVNAYGVAKVNQVSAKSGKVSVKLSTVEWPLEGMFVITDERDNGLEKVESFEVKDDDVANGDVVVTVTKNGAAADLTALAKGDVIAVKFDATSKIKDAKEIEIIATTDKITGQYTYYDDADELYEIGGAMYEAARSLGIEKGKSYTIALDPFGRLFSEEEDVTSTNYAILEKYVSKDYGSSSSDYDYIDVVTLDGQSKRLYIDNTDTAEEYAYDFVETLVGTVGEKEDFAGDAIEDRIIEYKVKTSTGRVSYVGAATDVLEVEDKYNATSTKLGKKLAASAVVLDAVAYEAAEDDAKASDYKASSLDALSSSVDYTAILVHKNSSNEYAYVILVSEGAKYGATSDFVVAAEASDTDNEATDRDTEEDVYQLRVMMDGNDEPVKLNIAKNAKVWKADYELVDAGEEGEEDDVYDYVYTEVSYADGVIAQGAAFLYTTNSYGFVDRIDVIFEGADNLADFATAELYTPDDDADHDIINAADWLVDVDEAGFAPDNDGIQIFVAPVLSANDKTVSFSEIKTASSKKYIDTDVDFSFGFAENAKIYAFDAAAEVNKSYLAFSDGAFDGIDVKSADEDGKAWIEENGENYVHDYQLALVMAVDGMVTNAFIITE